MSWIETARSGAPRTVKRPACQARSSSAHSSRCAAIFCAFARSVREMTAVVAGQRLLRAELLVAELLETEVQRRVVVARVVLEAGRGDVRELLRLDEVVETEPRRVDAELVRSVLNEALDQVRGLGDAER